MKPKFIESFIIKLNDYENLLRQITNKSAEVKKSISKWSRKEILGHLIDSANVNYNRFINAVFKDDLVFGTYSQNEWVELQSYNGRDWDELIQLWKMLNLHISNMIKNIPDDKRLKTSFLHNFDEICWSKVKQDEKSSLDYLIKDYISHLEHHINQIFEY